MSAINIRLPESLHKKLRDLTTHEETSMNQFIVSAIAEKIAVYHAEEIFSERVERGKTKHLHDVLQHVRKRPVLDERDSLVHLQQSKK